MWYADDSAAAGTLEFIEEFISDKVNCWIEMIDSMSDIAKSQPHAALAAYIHGIANPALQSASEFSSSLQTTRPLANLIQNQCPEYPLECIGAQINARKDARQQCQDQARGRAQSIYPAFFDIHIFNPLAQSNNQPIQACYR